MPTSKIKIGNYNTYGYGTVMGQTKIHLTEMYMRAQKDIHGLMMDKKIRDHEMKDMKIKNIAILKLNKTYRDNQEWLDSLDIGHFESVEDYFMNLKAKENGIDVLSGKDYDSLKEEHDKLKSLYMKMILN
jgi:hypothetical protein|tara:strand:- start:676 stop:1065 length:390 start_codon:yes stop_codon:yes gene_type:complete